MWKHYPPFSSLDGSEMAEKAEDQVIFTKQFKGLYLQYAGELIFFARKFVDNPTAEDIVHDIFLRIWEKKSTIVVEKDTKNYLFSVVQNACYDYLKHQSIAGSFLDKALQQLSLDELTYYKTAGDDVTDQKKVDAIYVSIEKLPPKSRDIFKKAYLEGQKHTTIAEELHISIRTVETHIYKALKFLRNHLTILIHLLFFSI